MCNKKTLTSVFAAAAVLGSLLRTVSQKQFIRASQGTALWLCTLSLSRQWEDAVLGSQWGPVQKGLCTWAMTWALFALAFLSRVCCVCSQLSFLQLRAGHHSASPVQEQDAALLFLPLTVWKIAWLFYCMNLVGVHLKEYLILNLSWRKDISLMIKCCYCVSSSIFLTIKIWGIVRESCIHWKKKSFQQQLFKQISVGSCVDLAMLFFSRGMTVSMVFCCPCPVSFSIPCFEAAKLLFDLAALIFL